MNSDKTKATVQRWLPLARLLTGGLIGVLMGANIAAQNWPMVAVGVISLAALWAQPTWDLIRWRKNDRSRKCTLCGDRPMWLYSLIPPPTYSDRMVNRHVLPIWTVWSACEAHDARVREVVEQVLSNADCDAPGHDHDGLRLYGVSSQYMKRGVR